MSPGRMDVLTSALSAVARLIMDARSDRDAEAIVHQLRALGPAQRADVDAVEAAALARIGSGTCGLCRQPYAVCVCDPMTMPIVEGDR